MSRRHLESALVAGALIESGLKPCFRFTRIRFVRHCFPPGYNKPYNASKRTENPTLLDESLTDLDTYDNSTILTRCTCYGIDDIENKFNHEDTVTTLGSGDCHKYISQKISQDLCNLHRQDYLKRHPWRQLQDDYAIHAVQFTGDAKCLVAGSANTSVRVIQTADGFQRTLPRPSKWTLGMPITAIRFMPPKLFWALGCNSHGEVFAFNPNQEGFETLFKEPQQTYTIDVSPDGSELATGGVDRKIRIYTLQPGSVLGMPREIKENTNNSDISGTDVSMKNNMSSLFASDHEHGDHHYRFQYPGGRPDQIVDTTTKPYILTRCYGIKDTDNLRDQPEPVAYTTGRDIIPPLKEYIPTSPGINITEGHSKRIMALRYHPQKPNILFSAGWDNLVKIWDTRIQTGPVLQIFGPHVASPDGLDVYENSILTASWRAKNSLEIWDLRVLNLSTGKNRSSANLNIGVTTRPGTPEDIDGTQVTVTFGGTASSGVMRSTYQNNSTPSSTPNSSNRNDPVEVIPVSGSVWGSTPANEHGEYLYAARLLPSRAVVAGGSGFPEVRVVSQDTLLPIARIPVDSIVQSMDTILDGRYIGIGCSSGTVTIIALA